MNFARSFIIERENVDKVAAFFKAVGFRLEKALPNYYKFSRGTWRRGLIYGRVGFWATDLKKYPTIAEVIIVDKGNISQLFVNYEVRTAGLLVTRERRARIVTELEKLEAFIRGR